jgi:hypothetical protein
LSWTLVGPRTDVAVHLRADNLFDQHVAYQVGLPNPGRVLSAGLTVGF